jgi:RND family efflux transporter MFP subunit
MTDPNPMDNAHSSPDPHHDEHGHEPEQIEGPRKGNRAMKGILVGAAAVIGVVGILAAKAFTREPPPPTPEPEGIKVTGQSVTIAPGAVQWDVVKPGNVVPAQAHWSDPVPARIKIDEALASKVASPLAGRVTKVYVELGQKVKAGDPLFAVSSPDIAGLKAEREKAALDVEAAKTRLDRTKALVETHALPAKDEIEAEEEMRQTQLELRIAYAKLGALKVSPNADNEFTLLAPRDGSVVEKNVYTSQGVSADSDSLMTIADLSDVWVVADLFEADAIGVKEGAAAKITSPSLPGVEVESKVEMVSDVVDPDRHTVPVRVRLPNPDRSYRPNTYAMMEFKVDPTPGAVEVPASALVSDGEETYVYKQVGSGEFKKWPVIAGPSRQGTLLITKGLQANDVIAVQGAILLDNQIQLTD